MIRRKVSINKAIVRKHTAAAKKTSRRIQIKSVRGSALQLFVWDNANFTGRNIIFEGGEVAVRDMRVFQFNDAISSLQVVNNAVSSRVTLLLFEDIEYRGRVRIIRGSQNLTSLGNFDNLTSSFVLVARRLNDRQIQNIRRLNRPPTGVVEISQG